MFALMFGEHLAQDLDLRLASCRGGAVRLLSVMKSTELLFIEASDCDEEPLPAVTSITPPSSPPDAEYMI